MRAKVSVFFLSGPNLAVSQKRPLKILDIYLKNRNDFCKIFFAGFNFVHSYFFLGVPKNFISIPWFVIALISTLGPFFLKLR